MKFSIITPSYNQGQFIEQTIKSVIEQEGDFEIEYLVMDGGSKDNSVEIIQNYAAKYKTDPRVTFKWVSEKDKGQSDAINKGLRLVTGDIVAYLNSDDYYYPGTFQKVAHFFELNPKKGWMYGQVRVVDEKGIEIRGLINLYRRIMGYWYGYSKLLVVNFIPQPATFWRATVMQEVGYINEAEHFVMDYEYWCRLGKVQPAGCIHEYLSAFRIHSQSKGETSFEVQFKDELRVAKQYTTNPFINWLHALHIKLIIGVYKRIS